jgi:hypothetical protein
VRRVRPGSDARNDMALPSCPLLARTVRAGHRSRWSGSWGRAASGARGALTFRMGGRPSVASTPSSGQPVTPNGHGLDGRNDLSERSEHLALSLLHALVE